MTSLTVAEALEALAAASGEREEGVPPNTYPMHQIAQRLGMGKDAIHTQMKAWLESGDVRVVQYRKRGLDGRLLCLRGFQFQVPVKAVAKRKRKR